MSSRFHPRAPAFAGLRPPEPRFAATSPATRDALGAVAGPGDWLRMEGRRTEPDGYYRLIDRAGSGLFVKVVPDAHAGRQLSADRLSEELGSLGIPVSLLLPGFPRPLGTGHSVFAYAHLRSRFAAASEGELFRVGACVARLHLAMARVQGRAAIRIAGEAKIGALLSRRDLILRGASAGPAPEKLRRMLVQQEGLSEGLLHQPLSQPVHADLVYGNILAPLDGGPLVVIDFEDALISWHPPFYDLALVIERFVLVAEPDDGRASELAGALLRGYGSVSAAGLRSGLPLRAMLELLSLRALLMLSDIEAAGGMVAPREWEKFFGLHDLAVARTALLARLDAMRNG